MSYQAIIVVLALALLLSGVAEQADNDLNEALGIKHTPLLQLIVGTGTGLLFGNPFDLVLLWKPCSWPSVDPSKDWHTRRSLCLVGL